jgi:predicted AAA+ superfamily ATPase
MDKLEHLITRAEGLIDKLNQLLPAPPQATDWSATAWHWQSNKGHGYLEAINHPHQIKLDDLHHIDRQKAEIVRNTNQFVKGFTANNVLLTGARGTGKSSIIKALLNAFAVNGLRIIEVQKPDLVDLPQITTLLRNRPERFIIYCDDLSFETGDAGYKALKVVLDGSVSVKSDNLLIYATSNRKNLLPALMSDNLATEYAGDEVRPSDTVEEKTSLSDRFGIWLAFYPFAQDAYLTIAAQWLKHFGIITFDDQARTAALSWAHTRGARSGRVAYQFARDYAGRTQLLSS